MAVFDRELQRIVLRIVYDGPAQAGKTTNLVQLHRFFTSLRRGELVSHAERAGRTLFFDWLHVDGGLVGGYPLRCQLTTVPGQAVLSHRRRVLLASADAVVFVCDSNRDGVEIGRRMAADLPREEQGGEPRVPIVVQANKQDQDTCLEADTLPGLLGLASGTPALGARAHEGVGVRETLVLAIRAAANRVQRHILERGLATLVGSAETHEGLLQRLENTVSTHRTSAGAALDALGAPPTVAVPAPEPSSASAEPAVGPAVPAGSAVPAPAVGASASVVPSRPAVRAPEPSPQPSVSVEPAVGPAVPAGAAVPAPAVGASASVVPSRPAVRAPEPSPQPSASVEPAVGPAVPAVSAVAAPVVGTSASVVPSRPAVRAPEPSPQPSASVEPAVAPAVPAGAAVAAPVVGASASVVPSRPAARAPEPSPQPSASVEPAVAARAADAGRSPDTLPALPSTHVPLGFVWPAALGRGVLQELDGRAVRRRDDLVGRHGTSDGSGRSDALIFEAGDLCLKTSLRRRFDDSEAGRAAMLHLARRKTLLGPLLPPRTVLCLQPESRSQAVWLWTVSPWVTTLRTWMTRAVEEGDEAALQVALEAFARAAVDALALAARAGVALDVHPSNFAVADGRVVYLDDDVATGERLPAIGHVLLRRVEEYARFPQCVTAYLSALRTALGGQLAPEEIAQLGLRAAFLETTVRAEAALAARAFLVAAVESLATPRPA